MVTVVIVGLPFIVGTGRIGRDRRLRRAVAVLPIPAYAIWLGDILEVSGQKAAARREYALVGAIEKLFAANGVRTELQTAVFDLDHDRSVADALARARTAYESAPSIYAEDALAWGLYRTGRCEEARTHSVRALRLGTRDALLVFHRAMIERGLRVHTGGCPAHHTVKDARKVYLGRRTPPRRHRGQELREAA